MAEIHLCARPQHTSYCDHCGVGNEEIPVFRLHPSKNILLWLCALCLQKEHESAIAEIERLTTHIANLEDDVASLKDEIWGLYNGLD